MKRCGNCRHWHGALSDDSAVCRAPLPIWAAELVRQSVYANEGEHCPVFAELEDQCPEVA